MANKRETKLTINSKFLRIFFTLYAEHCIFAMVFHLAIFCINTMSEVYVQSSTVWHNVVSCRGKQPNKPLDFGCHMKIRTIATSTHTISYVPNLTSLLFFSLTLNSLLDFEITRLALCSFFFSLSLYTYFLSFVLLPLSTLGTMLYIS